MKYRMYCAELVRMSQPSKVRKSVMPLTPPVYPCWPMIRMVNIAAMAWVMMAKYTPPTRRLNMATPIIKANSAGTAMTANKVKLRLWKGSQNQGSSVSWFQSMKSGMPGVD